MGQCPWPWVDLGLKVICPLCLDLDQVDLMALKVLTEVIPAPHSVAQFPWAPPPILGWEIQVVDQAQPQVVDTVVPALHTTLPPAQHMQDSQEHQARALYSQDLEPLALHTVGLREGRPLHTLAWGDQEVML